MSCVALALGLGASVLCTSGLRAQEPAIPDGVCYPVNGTGYIVTYSDALAKDGLKIPIGTLTPLLQGDSLVVETGTITFMDFRNGQSAVFGQGSRLVIPMVVDPDRPSWWQRLEAQVARSLSDPERKRIGGSVRGGQAVFWPDGGRFAMDIPIVFEWWRVRPAPVLLRIQVGDLETELTVAQDKPGSGALAWKPSDSDPSGAAVWMLVDRDGDVLGGGAFELLTKETADAERMRFTEAAKSVDAIQPGLAAAVLAASERLYLW